MRGYTTVVGLLAVVFVAGTLRAEEPPAAGKLVTIEAVIADLADGAADEAITPDSLMALEKAGKVQSLSRIRLATIENQRAQFQFGERVPVVTGQTRFGGRGDPAASIAMENVGTVLEVIPSVEADGSILMQLTLEISRLLPSPPGEAPGEAATPMPPRSVTVSSKTTVRLKPGQPAIVAGQQTSGGKEPVQTWIVLTASSEGAPERAAAAEPAPELRIFHLRFAKAADLAKVLSSVFEDEPVRIGVDERTNAILVHGPPEKLAMVEALLRRLDEESPRE
jgi:type II secretory pathway component GspD/PulD (secretin)